MATTSSSTFSHAHVLPATKFDIPIIADIVFVHGLKGHPSDTWLYGKQDTAHSTSVPQSTAQKRSFRTKFFGRNKSGADQSSSSSQRVGDEIPYCFWPYDLLPRDETISQARILLYGYDSHPTHFYKAATNRMTITQHAENLMHNLAGVRDRCQGRPLIFVAHSLGGILVKGALNESRQMTQQQYSDLLSSCRAIIFMGTPHLGAEVAAWGTMMSNIVGALPGGFSTYSGVLRGLEPDSETLYAITRRFNEILNQAIPDRDKIQICSVQEGLGMSSIKGVGSKVVPDYSSKFNRTDIEQSFFNQTANHMTMCKFSSGDDQTYKNILRVLKGYFRAISERQHKIQQAQEANHQAIVSDFAKKLNFDGRLSRESQLNTLAPDKHTFDWIWESNFVEWLKCDAKIFWIAGKPASGKSTLVNYVANHDKTRELMEEALGQDPIIAKFFFDFRAKDGIENNFEGLRRSLLYQLLTTSKTLATELKQHFGMYRLDDQLMLASFGIFEFVLQKNDQLSLLFIDGLDEYQGDKPELLNLIQRITNFKVKVCLSSRYEKPFTIAFRNLAFQFRMDLLNKPGIREYSKRTLIVNLRPSNNRELQALQTAAETVANLSDGVFLWSQFAVFEIIDRWGEGHNIDHVWIQKMIVDIPPNLEQIYARAFQNVKEKDRKACAMIFSLIRSGQRVLRVAELFEAVLLVGENLWSHQDSITSMDLPSFQQYLMSVGAGLIEFSDIQGVEQRDQVSVRLIHKSVETYMCKKGWKELFGDQLDQNSDHEIWIEVCIKYLTTHPTSKTRFADYIKRSVLRKYVYIHFLDHAYSFEREMAKSSRPLIFYILDTNFIRRHVEFCSREVYLNNWSDTSERSRWNDCSHMGPRIMLGNVLHSDVHLAICHRLKLYVEEAITLCPEAFKSDPSENGFSTRDQNRSLSYCRFSWPTASVRDPMTSPLATALLLHYRDPTPERSNLIFSLIPHSSRLEDTDMLMAVREAPKAAIEALLMQFPQGPLYLLSRSLCHKIADEHDSEHTTLPVEHPIGPLWELGGRTEHEEVAEILALLLARGEEINSQCSPMGTILHSVVFNHLMVHMKHGEYTDSIQNLKSMFRVLIAHGADVNTPGPEGNVLEYVWKLAHTEPPKEPRPETNVRRQSYTAMIEHFIGLGATNSIRDPNGLIPSRVRMLAVVKRKGPSDQDRRYYFFGACSDAKDEAACHRFVGRSMLSQVQRFSEEENAKRLEQVRQIHWDLNQKQRKLSLIERRYMRTDNENSMTKDPREWSRLMLDTWFECIEEWLENESSVE